MFVKLSQRKRLAHGFRVKRGYCLDVTASHSENVIGLFHRITGQHAAPLPADVDAHLLESPNGIFARCLPIDRADTGRNNSKIPSIFQCMAQQTFSHGTAADVSSADEQNGFHTTNEPINLGRSD